MAVTLRKPPQVDTDSFVASGAQTGATSATNPSAADQARHANAEQIITRPDGKAFREMTVYLPADLARRLSLHCMESDRDVSNVMAEMVRGNLDGPPPPAPIAPPPTLQGMIANNLEMGREMVLSFWRNLRWAH